MGKSNNIYFLKDLFKIRTDLNNTIDQFGQLFYTSKKYILLRNSDNLRNNLKFLQAQRFVLDELIKFNINEDCGYCTSTFDVIVHKQDNSTVTVSRKETYIKKLGDKYKVQICDTLDDVTTCKYIYKDIPVHGNCAIWECNVNKIISEIESNITSIKDINP